MAMNSAIKIQSIKWHKIDVNNPETWPPENKKVLIIYKNKGEDYPEIITRKKSSWWLNSDTYPPIRDENFFKNCLWAEIPMPPYWLIKGK